MMEGRFVLTNFKSLSAVDQLAVQSHAKMVDYLACLSTLCEVRSSNRSTTKLTVRLGSG